MDIDVKGFPEDASLGIIFNAEQERLSGMRLEFDARQKTVTLADIVDLQTPRKGEESRRITERGKITDFSVKNKIKIEAIRRNEVCDILINGEHILVGAGRTNLEECIEIYAQGCDITVENIKYEPFNEVQPRSTSTKPIAPRRTKRSR